MKLHNAFIVLIILLIAKQTGYGQVISEKEIERRNLGTYHEIERLTQERIRLTDRDTGHQHEILIPEKRQAFSLIDDDEQVFDLNNIDTTLYNFRYTRKKMLSFGGLNGKNMLFNHFNNNSLIDVAASYKVENVSGIADCMVAELQSDSSFLIKRLYTDTTSSTLGITDVDLDGRDEINFNSRQFIANYRPSHPDSFPDTLSFRYKLWDVSSIQSSETFTDLDGDDFVDFIYFGYDSMFECCKQVIVAEFDTSTNTYDRKLVHRPSPNDDISGFSVGDFDQDGYMEFATGSIGGDLYVFENTGNNSYSLVFQDTLDISNAYITATTNDIDNNGKPELFLGGSTTLGGTRVYWLESNGNNHYETVRSFQLLGTDVFRIRKLYIYDENADGVEDLVFASA